MDYYPDVCYNSYYQEKKRGYYMKKIFCALFAVTLCFTTININVFAESEKPDIDSGKVLLVDNVSGKYLYKEDIDSKIQPGGFVKIMTAIIAIENMASEEEAVAAKSTTLEAYDYSFGNMGILAGEALELKDLLYGMLLYDAGDAAEVIADYSLGSRSKFIKEMNEKAVDIGALNTKFTNPTGYPDKNQYSTLEDIYKITKYAMKLPMFTQIVNTGMHEIAPTNKYRETRYLPNSNKFITRYSSDKYYTSKATGVKTSYIDDSNCGLILQYDDDKTSITCLVAEAEYDGNLNYAYEDAKALLKYGLNYYKSVKVISKDEILAEIELNNGKGVDRILLEVPEDLYVNLPKDYDKKNLKIQTKIEKNVKAPISKGQALGMVKVIYNDEEYASVVLTSPEAVEADNIKGILKSIWSVISSPKLLVTLGLLLIIFVWSTLIFNRRKQAKIRKSSRNRQ